MSSVSTPNAWCSSAVRCPRQCASAISCCSVLPRSPCSFLTISIRSVTYAQPSPWFGISACNTQSAVGPSSIGPTSSTDPSRAGAFLKPATSVRKRPISSSGWIAGFEPAKSLEHHAADTDRRIRLLARAALDVGCCRTFALDAAEQARSSKGEAGDFARTVAIIRAHPGQQHADEPVVGKGIDQNAARGVVLHLSQYRRCWGLRVPQNAHRQEIFARRLTSRRDVQDQDDSVVARTQRDGIRNADIRNT